MIQEWRILNAAFVGNLRKLSIGNILSENAELGFVNVSFFTSLVILRIQFETNGISDFDAVRFTFSLIHLHNTDHFFFPPFTVVPSPGPGYLQHHDRPAPSEAARVDGP